MLHILILHCSRRYEEHTSPNQHPGAEPGLLRFWHGLVRVLPHRGGRHASPPHHEHPGHPADVVAGRVRHRGLRGPLWQRDHQPPPADSLVPQTDGKVRHAARGRRGRALRAAVRDHADFRGRHDAILRACVSQAQVFYQVWRRGHVRPVLGVPGGHRSIRLEEERKVAERAARPAGDGGC